MDNSVNVWLGKKKFSIIMSQQHVVCFFSLSYLLHPQRKIITKDDTNMNLSELITNNNNNKLIKWTCQKVLKI